MGSFLFSTVPGLCGMVYKCKALFVYLYQFLQIILSSAIGFVQRLMFSTINGRWATSPVCDYPEPDQRDDSWVYFVNAAKLPPQNSGRVAYATLSGVSTVIYHSLTVSYQSVTSSGTIWNNHRA